MQYFSKYSEHENQKKTNSALSKKTVLGGRLVGLMEGPTLPEYL